MRQLYKGAFPSQEDVMRKFPNGGADGMWLHIKVAPTEGIGVAYDAYEWNTANQRWEMQEAKSFQSKTNSGNINSFETSMLVGLLSTISVVIILGLSILVGNWVNNQPPPQQKPISEMTREEYKEYLKETIEITNDIIDKQKAFPNQ